MLRYTLRNPEPASFPRPEGMPEALHRLLTARGIASAEEAAAFLDAGVGSLLPPMRLGGMAEAAARVRAAMDRGEVVCVYGDYDVDGVCASAILSGWLNARGVDARVYLPSRHSEGYGLNEGAVRAIAEWADLMVTVDCGVTSTALVALAKSLGLDVVVTDHHQPPEGPLPDCPVVDPVLGGYPFPHLCGAGVAWKLVWALSDPDAPAPPPEVMDLVDIAALATVADVVSLQGENRAIVRLGLEAIGRGPRPGIAALIQSAGLTGKPVNAGTVAFQLAPRLNAGGRLGSAQRSLELVMETDPEKARALAEALEAENTRRRDVEKRIVDEAQAQLADFDFPAHRALILAGRDWNPGVIGLAASRLVEQYGYPTILLADQGDHLTGSCRSIPGVDIHAALTGCAHTIVKFGGHRQAAGLTLLPEQLEPFRRAMDAWLEANVPPEAYIPVREYDAELDFGSVTAGFIAALEGLQPTGYGNPAPVFRAKAHVVEARAVGADGAHLRLTLAQGGHRLTGVAFREGARAQTLPEEVDALFVPKLNTFMGRREPELELKALSDADVLARLDAKLVDGPGLYCRFLTEVFYNRKILSPEAAPAVIEPRTLRDWMAERPQGTLVLAGDVETARRLAAALADCPPDLCVGALPDDPRCFNALCLCPTPGPVPAGYRRVVLAGVPWAWLSEDAAARACRLPEGPAWRDQLPDVEAMRETYKALARLSRRPAWCPGIGQLARMAAEEAGQAEVTAAASLLAMVDMGLFELDLQARPVALRRSDRPKASPEDSAVWNAIQQIRKG